MVGILCILAGIGVWLFVDVGVLLPQVLLAMLELVRPALGPRRPSNSAPWGSRL